MRRSSRSRSWPRMWGRAALALILASATVLGSTSAPARSSASPATSEVTTAALPAVAPPSTMERGGISGTGSDLSLIDLLADDTKTTFDVSGHSMNGSWSSTITLWPLKWTPGAKVEFKMELRLSPELWDKARALAPDIDRAVILVTAERDFDPQGLQRLPHDQFMSTLLTPTHLPIEGGGMVGALSRFTGATYRTPLDLMLELTLDNFAPLDSSASVAAEAGWQAATFTADFNLPKDLPPGIYRLRFDLGVRSARATFNLNGDGIGGRAKDSADVSVIYSPPIPAAGKDATGAFVDGATLTRHMYWILLNDYNSNGYRGVVAAEDQDHFAISPRSIMEDEIILPLYDAGGKVIAYNLEPTFITDTMDPQRAFAYDYTRGEWSVKVYGPDGGVQDLGTATFPLAARTSAAKSAPRRTATCRVTSTGCSEASSSTRASRTSPTPATWRTPSSFPRVPITTASSRPAARICPAPTAIRPASSWWRSAPGWSTPRARSSRLSCRSTPQCRRM